MTLIDFGGSAPAWGPTGQTVYERTYQRVKPNGERETWGDTVYRVVTGNLSLVYGDPETWTPEVQQEAADLARAMFDFKVIPAGRHLWASGVKGRQYLFNCHVSGWTETFSEHFSFTFLRLMEGGGVGANYSSRFLKRYGVPKHRLNVHIVCDPSHPDYQDMRDAGILSDDYTAEWDGAFEVDDSREGWADALTDLLDTYFADDVKHANRVYDVTNVRAAGARLKTFGGTASGPAPLAVMLRKVSGVLNGVGDRFWAAPWEQANPVIEQAAHVTPLEAMEIDHAIAECVVSGGNRRSARMSIVEWDDPFIHEFIACKADQSKHWTTNISVAVDDRFMRIIGGDFSEKNPPGVIGDAFQVHEEVVAGMLANGEPGYWNRSLSQHGEVKEVVCTNPCGEIALEEFENCNLGHVNLQAFVDDNGAILKDELLEAHRLMTRFLIRATFGDVNDDRQAAILAANRRIGVGHLGVQGYLALTGTRYSEATSWYIDFPAQLRTMRETVRDEARAYAFALRIPEPVKTTTVAPTGSIAKLPGVPEGIHAVYARWFIQRVRFSTVDPEQVAQVERYRAEGYHVEDCVYAPNTVVVSFPTQHALIERLEAMGIPAEILESQDEIGLEEMLAFQAMYQTNYADNAVSFTVNVPEDKYDVAEVEQALSRFLPEIKGVTLMVDGSREQAPYERISKGEYLAAEIQRVGDGIDEDCANGACPIR